MAAIMFSPYWVKAAGVAWHFTKLWFIVERKQSGHEAMSYPINLYLRKDTSWGGGY